MPHTRAARLKALKEAAESRNTSQMQNLNPNMGWNDYLNWDVSALTYQQDSLNWFSSAGAASEQPHYFDDTQTPTTGATNGLPRANSEKASNSNFCGLQPWYSRGVPDFSSVSPAATTRLQASGSEFNSYGSTSFDEECQPPDQSFGSQPWSPKISRQLSSVSDGAYPRISSNSPVVELIEELDNAASPSSEDENVLRNTARVDANKKRKIAHSLIEKNYRSRIKDGMAELRHCVPSTAKGRSSLDSKRPGSQQAADDATPNHSSGKVATLSDAVQYVKSLKLENEALHGRLDVMQRRNNTLQKIALSKVDTNTPATATDVEELDEDDAEGDREGVGNEQASKRSKKSPLDRARCDDSNGRREAHGSAEDLQKDEARSKTAAHAPSRNRRPGSVTKSVAGTVTVIKISED